MRNVLLLTHPPSQATREWLATQEGDWVMYRYFLHVEKASEIERSVLGCVSAIHDDLDLESVQRLVLVPPGYSLAVLPMTEALRGISGLTPEVLALEVKADGSYGPAEKAVVNTDYVYRMMRKKRSFGVCA